MNHFHVLFSWMVSWKIYQVLVLFSVTPSPPTRLTMRDIMRDTVTLEWEPPEYDGGSHLTGYLIEKRDARKNRWQYVHKVEPRLHEYTVPGLITGRDYFFRVRPMNIIGLGDAIQQEEPVRIQTPYREYL